MFEKIFRLLTTFIVGIWLIRYLGPENFGLLSYAQSFVVLFSAVSNLGLDGIVVRELVENKSREAELLGTSFTLKFIGAFLSILAIYIALLFTSESEQLTTLVFIVSAAAVFQSFIVIDFYFQSEVKLKYVALVNSAVVMLSSIIKIGLILAEAELFAFAAVAVLDAAVVAVGLIFVYSRYGKGIKYWRFRYSLAKELLGGSWPLIISFFFTTLTLRIDQVVVKNSIGAESLGYYVASLRLVEIFYFIPVVISTVLFPKIIKLKGKEVYSDYVQALGVLLTYIALLIIVFFSFFSEDLISVLYGESYLLSSEVFIYHLFAMLFVFNFSLRKKLLLVENLNFYILYYSIVTSILMTLSIIVMVEVRGLVGAAQGYMIAWFLSLLLVPLLFRRPTEVTFFLWSFNPVYLVKLYKLRSLRET